MKHRSKFLLGLFLLVTCTSCGYDAGPTTLDIRPGESDQPFGDAFITFDENRWQDVRANWWNPFAHLAAQAQVVDQLLSTQPTIDNQPAAPLDYYANFPEWARLIPWRDRINIEVSLHIFDDALRGHDQREMHFSPYWIYRGFFEGERERPEASSP